MIPPATGDADRAPLAIHVVSHTHWDREWYHLAGRFRQRLVALVDELLDAPPAAPPCPPGSLSGGSFLLDGQAIVLEDYLAVRPDRRASLERLLRDGSLEAGPWYVLGDELTADAESLVRNLLIGRATVRALGGEPPPVLYSPDAFGHPAALPALAAGFGCAVIILWRGYGGPHWPAGDAARWVAPDGSAALLYHLPPAGYETGANLPAGIDAARARWAELEPVLVPRAVLGIALLLNGADHHAPQPDLAAASAALAAAAAPTRVLSSSLRTFAGELAARAAARALPIISGELRDSYGYTWALQGTFGARAALKRRNAQLARLLTRDAEPWLALARLAGERTHCADVTAAWRTLLQCHPHDTLCGTAADPVARAMAARLDDAEAQATGLRESGLLALAGHDPEFARTRTDRWRPVLLLRNPAARARGGIAQVEVILPRHRVRVGPGTAPPPADDREPPRFVIDGLEASAVQILARELRHDLVESPRHYPDAALVDASRALVWLPPMPGYSTAAASVHEAIEGDPLAGHHVHPSVSAGIAPGTTTTTHGARGARAAGGAASTRAWIENDALSVAVTQGEGADGAIVVQPRAGGAPRPPLSITLEDIGDAGDLYTPSLRPPGVTARTLRELHVAHDGPLRAELQASWEIDIPKRFEGGARSRSTLAHVVHVALALDAGAPALRVRVWGENAARDHRLRVIFATALPGAAVHADAAFGPVQRDAIVAPDSSAETPPPTAPLHRYVTLATPERGCTIISDGLAEYEAMPDGRVAITLLRAVGELSRADLPERPGHAGWPTPTPEAQSLGPYDAAFALFPHGPRDAATIDRIEQVTDDILLPLCGVTLRSALAVSAPAGGLTLEGRGLAFSTCKESDYGGWTVLRAVNLTDERVAGRWVLGAPVREARHSRLDEQPGELLPVLDGAVAFEAPPRAVVTILVR